MSFFTLYSSEPTETHLGELIEQSDAHVVIRERRRGSSKYDDHTFPMSAVRLLDAGTEGSADAMVIVGTSRAAVMSFDLAEDGIEANEDGSITITYLTKDGEGTAVIPAGGDFGSVAAVTDAAPAAAAKPAGRKAAAAAEPAPAKRGRGKPAEVVEEADDADPADDANDDDAIIEAMADLDDDAVSEIAVALKLTTAKKAANMDRDALEALFEGADLEEVEAEVEALDGGEGDPEPEPEVEEAAPAGRRRKAAAEPEPAPTKRGAGRGAKAAAEPEPAKGGKRGGRDNW